MAILILGHTDCPLCDNVIATGQRYVATLHFLQDQSHPLWRYSDAAMHYDCFQRWPCREEFVAEYNRTIRRLIPGSRSHMKADGTTTTRSAVDGA